MNMKFKAPFKVIGIQFKTIDLELNYVPLIITEKETIKPKYYFIHDEKELKEWKRELDKEFCTVVFKEKFKEIVKIKIKYLMGGEELV